MSPADYIILIKTNDSEILDSSNGVAMSQIESNNLLNLTIVPDFSNFPGIVQVTLEARRTSDNSLFDSHSTDILVAGLVLYTPNSRIILSGLGRSFVISSYKAILSQPHRELGVFVQFLNGSNSNENLSSFPSQRSRLPFDWSSLSAVPKSLHGQILWDDEACAVDSGTPVGSAISLKDGCGMGFGPRLVDGSPNGVTFAFDFQPNRAGQFDILFNWPGFTDNSEFQGEDLFTFLTTDIGGRPPSIVRRITPENPFSRLGGEELHIETINTEDVNISSFNVNGNAFLIVPDSRQSSTDPTNVVFETMTFITEPGSGNLLPWTISGTRKEENSKEDIQVEFIDETGFHFSYDDAVPVLEAINPNRVPEEGGITVILSGVFPNFNPNLTNHVVLVGNVPIDPGNYELVSLTQIHFKIPSRAELGFAWSHDVVVQIGDMFTNPMQLEFRPASLNVKGQIFGVSLDEESGFFLANPCGSTSCVVTVADQIESTDRSYSWRILTKDKKDLLSFPNASSIVKDSDTLHLPNAFLPVFNTKYTIEVTVYSGGLSADYMFPVMRSPANILGVTLLDPEDRTISTPPVNMRIIAKIDVQECITEPSSLVYEWEYENKSDTLVAAARLGVLNPSVHDTSLLPEYKKFVFSFENDTGTFDDTTTPTRLGRELIVPRELLTYGTHRIRLKVLEHGTNLFGISNASVTITKSPLIAKIGTGQLKRHVSDAEDLTMTGYLSFDPDIVDTPRATSGLSYEWSCQVSMHANHSLQRPCGEGLLPPDQVNQYKFKVCSKCLQNATELGIEGPGGYVYILYTLAVRKDNRESLVTQELCVAGSLGRRFSRYDRIDILNSAGEPVNPERVEFWEDVIIQPVSSLGSQWKFSLELPWRERSRFLAGDVNLITRPGYYVIRGNSAPSYQRLPLGILRDKLRPREVYQFVISFQETAREPTDVVVQFKTVEVPELIFPPLALMNGTTLTTFQALASTSFTGNATFQYQFYLLDQSGLLREYCIDGCTGAKIVRFRVRKPGNYILQCRMIAANGKTLLSVKNNSEIISVSENTNFTSVSQFDAEMRSAYRLGDDGGVNQKGFFISQSIHERDSDVFALSDESREEICTNYTQQWVNMSLQIVGNELPNTANARNYVILAANYARLRCVEVEDTMYELVALVDQSIARTPPEEVLTTVSYTEREDIPKVELEEELRRFYNFSMSRALSMINQGSSRQRLLSSSGPVNNLILDLAELWMKHVTATATSGRVCGWEASYTSSTLDGEPDDIMYSPPSSSSNSFPANTNTLVGIGLNTIRVAVMCNAEQGRSLSTPNARFEWCDAVYSITGNERKLITLAETFDYPHVSGVQGENASETVRVVAVDITTLGVQNQLVSALSGELLATAAAAAAQSSNTTGRNSPEDVSGGCYRIQMKMSLGLAQRASNSEQVTATSNESSSRSACMRNVPYRMWPRKTYGRQLTQRFEDGLYARWTDDIRVDGDINSPNDSLVVEARSNELGVYGAFRASCGSFLGGGQGPKLDGTVTTVVGLLIGMLVLILVIVGVTYMLVAAAVRATEDDEEADDEALVAANYVERDIFGRQEVRLYLPDDESGSDGQSTLLSRADTDLSNAAPNSGPLTSMLSGVLPQRTQSTVRAESSGNV